MSSELTNMTDDIPNQAPDSTASLKVGRIQFERGNSYSQIDETDGAFTFRTNNIQLKLTTDKFECLSKFKFDGKLSVSKVTSGEVGQWVLWNIDMFDPGKISPWMPGNISSCGRSVDFFLGGPCKLSKGRVNRFYFGIPQHSEIRLTGRVHFFDQWNGETLSLKVDNNVVWSRKCNSASPDMAPSEPHNWCPTLSNADCVRFGIDSCGQEYPDRISVHYDVSMRHSGGSMAVEFSSSLETDPCEASWGIDDVAVYIR
ncbi:membrane protein, putative [Babesia bigemina]|uniref:Membrane protein, putative n=1 Tax=Babesia bigemina TaxID=5866 RepID=A0A061D390_BABBI|nr:membrane protein, putative [Babesia bigemina]CDR94557.1 membrane protein, putative [Babesia bigemina]|eukprot:XP_012766743.1 membrane protein, putative [Babesia bigemina]